MKNKIIVVLCMICLLPFLMDGKVKKKKDVYRFKIDKQVKTTSVKSQDRTSTCWNFATMSFLESEILRTKNEAVNLSEMFIVRYTYPDKANRYVLMHGKANFAAGGESHDVFLKMKIHGLVPEEVYPGFLPGEKKHNHGEMHTVLSGMVDAVIKRRSGKLTKVWKKAFEKTVETYLGKTPEKFTYKGKEYTPKTFYKEKVGLNPDDYVEIASFSHHPYYQPFCLEIPDNWMYYSNYLNVPINELERIADNAINNGYSFGWAADISEAGFGRPIEGVCVVPKIASADMTKEEKKKKVTKIIEEKIITQEMRQEGFENYTTTDDHAMHITGIATAQNGKKFYRMKNSWGTDRKYKGYYYVSKPYFQYKTMFIVVHKDAIPEDIRKKLNL